MISILSARSKVTLLHAKWPRPNETLMRNKDKRLKEGCLMNYVMVRQIEVTLENN